MRKSMTKKLFCLLLTVAMVVGLVSFSAFAAADSIWVGGVEMESGTYLAEGATATTTDAPADNYAHYENGVLTLKNYEYEGEGVYNADGAECYDGINADGDLRIVLIGENSITVTHAGNSYGITCYGDLTVEAQGEGSVVFSGDENGIYLDGDLVVYNGTVACNADYCAANVYGDITVYGGTLIAKCLDSNTYTDDASMAISLSTSINCEDGTITASTEPDGVLGAYDEAAHDTYDYICIQGDMGAEPIWVGGVEMENGTYLAEGATATTTDAPADNYAHYENGVLTLKNYEYEGEGVYNADGEGCYDGINAEETIKIVLIGENSIIVTEDEDSYGITCWGSLIIEAQGAGRLTASASEDGVYTDDSLVINSGTVEGIGTYYGVSVYGDLKVRGGTLIAKCLDSDSYTDGEGNAINVDGEITCDDCEITASTEPDGILGAYDENEHDSYDYIKIICPEIWVGGVGMIDGDYLAEGATAATTDAPADNYAHYENGVLTLKNYEYVGEGKAFDTAYNAVIYRDGDLSLVLEGENSLTVEGEENTNYCYNIYVDDALTITAGEGGALDLLYGDGAGSEYETEAVVAYGGLTIESGNFYIEAISDALDTDYADVTINGGNIELNADSDGIYARNIYINGGKLLINAEYNDGLDADDLLKITGGEITITAGDRGFEADDVVVDGGIIKVVSKGDDTIGAENITLNLGDMEFICDASGEADGDYYAIDAEIELTIGDGVEVSASTEPDGELGEFVLDEIATYDRIKITHIHTGGEATCEDQAICDFCEEPYGEPAGHDFNEDEWGYQEDDGHAHECGVCGEPDEIQPHADEDEDGLCDVCAAQLEVGGPEEDGPGGEGGQPTPPPAVLPPTGQDFSTPFVLAVVAGLLAMAGAAVMVTQRKRA